MYRTRGPEGGASEGFGAGEGFGPSGFCAVTWLPFAGWSRSVCRLHVRVGVPWHCRDPSGWGVGETFCSQSSRAFPITPVGGQRGGARGWPVQLRPPGSVPGGLSGARGRTLSRQLALICRPSSAPRPTSPFIAEQESGGAGLPQELAPGVGTPVGGAAWWVPQGEGSRGSAWRPRSPSPTRDRHRDTAFAQKVIQQVLDQIPLFAYKDLFIEPPPPGSVSHPCMFGSL